MTQKQIIAETLSFKYSTFVSYINAYLKLFMKIGQKFGVQRHTKEFFTLWPTDRISC